MIRVKQLLFSLLLPLGTGAISYLLAGGERVRELYAVFPKPLFSLPGWAFPIVWTVLYLLMGLSYYLFRTSVSFEEPMRRMYLMQLLFNFLWLPVFFRMQQFGVALVIVCVLALSVLTLILMVRRASRVSAWLLAPYLAFLLYAGYLNYGVMALSA